MNTRLSHLVLAAFSFGVALCLGADPPLKECQRPGTMDACADWKDVTLPPNLQDRLVEKGYSFCHLSDVDVITVRTKRQKYQLTYWLRNTHKTQTLDFRWPAAGFKAQRIDPGFCCFKEDNTTRSIANEKSVIHYSPTGKRDQPALVYVEKNPAGKVAFPCGPSSALEEVLPPLSGTPPLTSRLYVPVAGTTAVCDFRLTSSVDRPAKGGFFAYSYTVENRGSVECVFTVSTLAEEPKKSKPLVAVWEGLEGKVAKQWAEGKGKEYRAAPKMEKGRTFRVTVGRGEPAERSLLVTLYRTDRGEPRELVEARVSAYLPSVVEP